MLRISNIKIDVYKNQEKILQNEIEKILRVKAQDIKSYKIVKQSIDARKKDKICFIYQVDAELLINESKVLKNADKRVSVADTKEYMLPQKGEEVLKNRPVVVGAGPAGLFAALILAQMGYKPLLLERGQDVDTRTKDVEKFWQEGILNTESNVQFGEGGAGAFSDGKLTTGISDIRCQKVLKELVKHGAPEEILYSFRPHIGTDILKKVVKNIRFHIIALGGEVRFGAKVTKLLLKDGFVEGVEINHEEILYSDNVILALGHSARDTFEELLAQGVEMMPKAFAVGVRIEHPQRLINESQYGKFADLPILGAADYKLTYKASNGRPVYSFCMCPGGHVVAAASEENRTVCNGMSYHARDGKNANSALVVGVTPADFADGSPLAGMEFQRRLEESAYQLANDGYKAPCQLVKDFLKNRPSSELGEVEPTYQPGVVFRELRECLPDYVVESLREAIPFFAGKIKGFAHPKAILTGVETRTSSPVRILRNNQCEAIHLCGLYPCGEGAGYAGGIVSAAVDGIRVAEEIIKKYASFEESL